MPVQILNAEPANYSEEARRILQSVGHVTEEIVSQDQLAAKVKDFDVLIVRLGLRVTQDVLEASVRLQAVVSATTGLDHIDLETARAQDIAVLSLQGEIEFLQSVTATPEHTWALLLALVRRVPWAYNDVAHGKWRRDEFRGHDLYEKRLGILGLGRVGHHVARYGLAFGMEVGAYDPSLTGWPEGVHRFDSPDDLLQRSEILSLHIPLNEKTSGFLDEEKLRLLPKGAWLINTSRGAILNEEALVRLLLNGHLAGAAVDVLAEEQPDGQRAQSPLINYMQAHDNLLVTPHLGGATFESMQRTEVFMAEKLCQFLKSQGAYNSL